MFAFRNPTAISCQRRNGHRQRPNTAVRLEKEKEKSVEKLHLRLLCGDVVLSGPFSFFLAAVAAADKSFRAAVVVVAERSRAVDTS